ncbi:MAG: hypothetical protein H3Z52_07655 [archaeon]|nr:hypothetical protein [archaeon]
MSMAGSREAALKAWATMRVAGTTPKRKPEVKAEPTKEKKPKSKGKKEPAQQKAGA